MMSRAICVSVACASLLCTPSLAKTMWVKGNTHTHTNLSDGDSPPEAVIDWYRANGYQFLVISDHNKLTDPANHAKPGSEILLIPGEEISAGFSGSPIHINALGIDKQLPVLGGKSKIDTLQKNIDEVVDSGGIAHINHPNWYYAFGARELSRVSRCRLLEICNASSGCNNEGDAGHPSMDAMWDDLLTKGLQVYGIACDDAHHYTKFGPNLDNPGRGWIVVRVSKLTQRDVLASIARGDFYASTGVELDDVGFRDGVLSLSIRPEEGKTFRIQFIGPGGKVVTETANTRASCKIGGHAYLRAKVTASDGSVAWTQPCRL